MRWPSNTFDWTIATRYAIGPDYLSRSVHGDNNSFKAYAKLIEERRAPSCRDRGARSLRDSSVNIILQCLPSITSEDLQIIPKHLVWKIWNEVNSRGFLNFHAWKILSKVLVHEDPIPYGVLRYQEHRQCPAQSLQIYTKPLISPSFDFIAFLSIDASFRVADLVQLTAVTNLGILEIYNQKVLDNPRQIPLSSEDNASPGVSDRLIRAWASVVVEKGAFPVLRVIKLWGHRDVTDDCLQHITKIRALGILDIKLCGMSRDVKRMSTAFGWKNSGSSHILERQTTHLSANDSNTGSTKQLGDRKPLWSGFKVIKSNDKEFHLNEASTPYAEQRNLQIDPEWHKLSLELFRQFGIAKEGHWEFDNLTAFSMLGELRNDSDLIHAGVPNICEAVVDTGEGVENVCSVPMVSLRLGLTDLLQTGDHHSSFYFETAKNHHRGIEEDTRCIFYRANFQQNTSSHLPPCGNDESTREGGSQVKTPAGRNRKDEQSYQLRPRKIRKLSKVLDMFG